MKSIIIYRLGSMGDTVISLPCLHKVSSSFPGYRKILLTNNPVSSKAIPTDDLLMPAGIIDEIINYNVGLRSIPDLAKLRKKIVLTGADTVIYLKSSKGFFPYLREYIFFHLSGIKNIIGGGFINSLLDNKSNPRTGFIEFEAERLARSIKNLGDIDLQSEDAWSLFLTEDELRFADAKLASLGTDKFIAINIGGKNPNKDWGQGNWKLLISEISGSYPDFGFVVVGSSDEWLRARDLLLESTTKSINLCGVLKPRQTAAILSKSSFFIGHDSGPLHLAASVQARCIGIFGNLNKPNKWHPYGNKHIVFHSMDGIDSINVSEVLNGVTKMVNSL
ncbi:glycosyltransferase family 9 protein [Polynucleobacter sp. P1-05-14]|uniref:glycosyltransferase family 9 protein n=1 Tax=Polynucleobacter sp. P1-05-14 TaxID=1819732 RepID=UPI001C0E7A46|nr:glycosyltransferase family 9 protein [Polynucleobacter sp. P1-05-14]MBU3548025.1 glycosyltransferase family 9 protein [Polynucleobacter sp. P1-05-14]